ncbi:nucleotidyltransferase family protein [Roseburia sp. BX1005]|uniref:Nucleotidyltransferase family protein n=1 Tax=Roseburia zhanii TaxID=2763064 RepID=A0A923LKS3_9FIRM|nr:nucleotidyltransferase family protein [Roseburia zhanii]MBC5712649.1 nucleotidyltransferase family protein [Roseburia zhanii]
MKTEQLERFLISPDNTVVEAMQKIDSNARGILFVVGANRKLSGVVTDGDIRRWLIRTGELSGVVEQVMNHDPKTIGRKDIEAAKKYMEKQDITALPVVTLKGIISDIVFREKKESDVPKHRKSLNEVPVVIMAGGKGTRLYPYTKILPKPLIPIGDIPIMERIIDKFKDFGVQQFYATVNYRKSMIKSYFSEISTDYRICYVEEDKPLGTAGSLRLITEPFTKPFIVTNCDILIHADYEDIYRHHKESENALTIVTAMKNMVVPYGVIHASENGMVESMEEKPRLSYFVNTGMYVLDPELIQEIPEDTFFHMTDLADLLLKKHKKVGMYPISEDSFLDMGEFEEMHRMEEKLNLKSE